MKNQHSQRQNKAKCHCKTYGVNYFPYIILCSYIYIFVYVMLKIILINYYFQLTFNSQMHTMIFFSNVTLFQSDYGSVDF